MKKYFFIAAALLMMSASVAKAQVTIGSAANPQSFSILELVSEGERGLRLPQMTFCEQEELTAILKGLLTPAEKNAAQGLQIFNTDTKCVETWNGSKWIQACNSPKEQILFTIETYDETYIIPTSGGVGGTYHTYDWNVSVDGVKYTATSTSSSTPNTSGITLTGLSQGEHQICITPHACPFTAGWGNAFGHSYDYSYTGANTVDNRNKIISIDAPLTTMAFAPNEGSTDASYMFARMFCRCENLTTPAKIVDTYKLPAEVTDLSHFLQQIQQLNTPTSPIDLRGLEGWLDKNTTITNLSNFLCGTHFSNDELEDPIDLTPLEGWFSENQSIEYMSGFLLGTHESNTNLKDPIDLTPLSGWFKENTKITDLSYFLYNTHFINTSLISPIDLAPLKDWFSNNTKITDLSRFLMDTYYNNTSLVSSTDLTPLSGWFPDYRSITNLSYFLAGTHYGNSSLRLERQKIFPDWIKNLEGCKSESDQTIVFIQNVDRAFYQMFYIDPPIPGKSDDIGEPEFESDSYGITKLSKLGNPLSPKQTYSGRTVFTNDGTIGNNWK
ncbi:MAG: hypothetical protein LBS54_00520 [Dysgonamonadaceae bacterium]|jgi:hypothetical protein|nr:hypothetical protein [Dysgonamonadaceae bacterium]